jgi:hypothetical protein
MGLCKARITRVIGKAYGLCSGDSEDAGESDAPFSGYLLFLFLLIVSRETFEAKRTLSGWIDRHSSRHSLKPTVISPWPACSSISLCSGVIGLWKIRVSWLHGLPISHRSHC